jgi:RecB family exonuclease
MIESLRSSEITPMELEYLFSFSQIVHQLGNLRTEFPSPLKIAAFYELYKQVVAGTSLPFFGEPLKGLQIMGMLETRTLDFENLIILSCNEDLLPSGKINSSYIPFDIKRSFDLPTYRHKDSVYAYHFYRLLQRAENVWILYNTEADQLGGGERSRFLRQITSELPSYNPGIVIRESVLTTPLPKGEPLPVIMIPKTGTTLEALNDKAVKGFSASSLNSYRNCPLKFYFAEIAGIREPEDVDDTIDPAVLGSAVHAALNTLYQPCLDKPLTKEHLSAIEPLADEAVDSAFEKKFKGSDITYGKNLLLVKVAKMMIKRFLQFEAAQLDELSKAGKGLTVAFLEQYVETYISIIVDGNETNIKLKGFIDRVDRLNGWWKIIDYKTGITEAKHVKVKEWEELIENADLNIGFQLLMYSFLLSRRFQQPISSSAGIISLKKLNTGFTTVSVPGDEPGKLTSILGDSSSARFEEILRSILSEVYDLSVPFSQTSDLDICERCPYINLCLR